jgi:hypothetical protein
MRTRTLLTGALLCAAVFGPIKAGTIVSLAGPVVAGGGLGEAPQQQIGGVEFTLPVAITGGTAVVMLDSSGNESVTAWLTNAVGPGTTTSNVLASDTFSVSVGTQQPYTTLSGLNVGPGTYYLVLEAVSQSNDVGWDYTNSPVITGTVNAGGLGAEQTPPFPFGPSAPFGQTTGDYLFQVTGNQIASTPEPATGVLVLTAIACLIVWSSVAGRKRARAGSA